MVKIPKFIKGLTLDLALATAALAPISAQELTQPLPPKNYFIQQAGPDSAQRINSENNSPEASTFFGWNKLTFTLWQNGELTSETGEKYTQQNGRWFSSNGTPMPEKFSSELEKAKSLSDLKSRRDGARALAPFIYTSKKTGQTNTFVAFSDATAGLGDYLYGSDILGSFYDSNKDLKRGKNELEMHEDFTKGLVGTLEREYFNSNVSTAYRSPLTEKEKAIIFNAISQSMSGSYGKGLAVELEPIKKQIQDLMNKPELDTKAMAQLSLLAKEMEAQEGLYNPKFESIIADIKTLKDRPGYDDSSLAKEIEGIKAANSAQDYQIGELDKKISSNKAIFDIEIKDLYKILFGDETHSGKNHIGDLEGIVGDITIRVNNIDGINGTQKSNEYRLSQLEKADPVNYDALKGVIEANSTELKKMIEDLKTKYGDFEGRIVSLELNPNSQDKVNSYELRLKDVETNYNNLSEKDSELEGKILALEGKVSKLAPLEELAKVVDQINQAEKPEGDKPAEGTGSQGDLEKENKNITDPSKDILGYTEKMDSYPDKIEKDNQYTNGRKIAPIKSGTVVNLDAHKKLKRTPGFSLLVRPEVKLDSEGEYNGSALNLGVGYEFNDVFGLRALGSFNVNTPDKILETYKGTVSPTTGRYAQGIKTAEDRRNFGGTLEGRIGPFILGFGGEIESGIQTSKEQIMKGNTELRSNFSAEGYSLSGLKGYLGVEPQINERLAISAYIGSLFNEGYLPSSPNYFLSVGATIKLGNPNKYEEIKKAGSAIVPSDVPQESSDKINSKPRRGHED